MGRAAPFLLAILLACSVDDSAGDGDYDTGWIDEDLPADQCGETDAAPCATESGGAEPACVASTQCNSGEICRADFDGDIGSFQCRSGCIADFDESTWCVDDSGCCSAASICGPRGYCMSGCTGSTIRSGA